MTRHTMLHSYTRCTPWTEIYFTVIEVNIIPVSSSATVKGHLLTPACHLVQAKEGRQRQEGGIRARKNNKPQELKKEKEEAPYNSGDL